jgi:probable F420-dependent oxidoreductase
MSPELRSAVSEPERTAAPADRQREARRIAERIGRVGVWSFQLERLPAAVAQQRVGEIEQLGYRAIWIPESLPSKEIFSHATLLLRGGRDIVIATGIANIWARDPVAMANGARAIAEAHPGRFILGLGVSHEPVVRRRGRGTYERPLQRMREYLDAMDRARYTGPEPAEPAPRLLAALGPGMLRLAAERTIGAHPYFVPVAHTPIARQTLGEGPLLAVEQAVVLERDPVRAREIARTHMANYLRLDNYANGLRRLGWSDADIANGGSDRLVDAIVAWGDAAAIRDRVTAHLNAGADHVCVQVLTGDPGTAPIRELRELGAALL